MARRVAEDTFTLSFIDLLSCMMGGAIILFLVFSSEPSRTTGARLRAGADGSAGASATRSGELAALWISLSATIDRELASRSVVTWRAGRKSAFDRGTTVTPPLTPSSGAVVLVEITAEENTWLDGTLAGLSTGTPVELPGERVAEVGSDELRQALVMLRRAQPQGGRLFIDSFVANALSVIFVGPPPPVIRLPGARTARLVSEAVFAPGSVREFVEICVDLGAGSSAASLSEVSITAQIGEKSLRFDASAPIVWAITAECLRARIPLSRLHPI